MSIYEKLCEKIQKEWVVFTERMQFATPASLIIKEYAYEIVVKEQIVEEISMGDSSGMPLTEDERELLLSKENTLDYLYQVWMKSSNTGLKGTEYAIAEAVGR